MKRICLILSLLLLMSGCATAESDSRICVMIEEIEGCTIENNGQWILPGDDVIFNLTFDYGLSLAGTDYSGKARTEASGRNVTLTLEDVRYPTRVKLRLTYNYAQITYHANGGDPLHSTEDHTTISYALDAHIRPNTDTGSDLFAREGHTLLCWNTEPDGSGTRVGLGSRVSVPEGAIDLYAQWLKWNDIADFTYIAEDTVTIIGYTGNSDTVVIPEFIDGLEVTAIAAGAFRDCGAQRVVFPRSMDTVEPGAFDGCSLEELTLFDKIISIGDDCFVNCGNLRTLYINAIEAPFGYIYRKESCYADKVDLLISAQGRNKLVFYGGCSMWYNLDGFLTFHELGRDYAIINMGLNGTVNSLVQMQIMGVLLEDGDILLHTPELSSRQQLLTNTDMLDTDKSLWCGIENNYDLFAYVNLQTTGGVFDSLCAYLDRKDGQAAYAQIYTDEQEQPYMDVTGSVPFFRNSTQDTLGDNVYLDPGRLDETSMARLKSYYDWYQNKGVRVYISYACTNLDAVPEDQKDNAQAVEDAFAAAIAEMDGPVLISQMKDFFFHNEDFYDTNYHLRSAQARENTLIWLRDLKAQMKKDGLWKEEMP